MARKIKEFKRCPRCDTKALIHQDKCNACGLIYSRLINASNKEAKKALKAGQKNRVIYDKTLPKDMNKWKLFFMTLFLGPWGGHYYYIGKHKTGAIFTVSMLTLLIVAGIAQDDMSVWQKYYFWLFSALIPAGACFIAYAVDVFRVLGNSFRVPIALKEDSVVVDKTNKDANTKEVLKIVEEVSSKVEKEPQKEDKKADKKSKNKASKTDKSSEKSAEKEAASDEKIDEKGIEKEEELEAKNSNKNTQTKSKKSSKKKGKK